MYRCPFGPPCNTPDTPGMCPDTPDRPRLYPIPSCLLPSSSLSFSSRFSFQPELELSPRTHRPGHLRPSFVHFLPREPPQPCSAPPPHLHEPCSSLLRRESTALPPTAMGAPPELRHFASIRFSGPPPTKSTMRMDSWCAPPPSPPLSQPFLRRSVRRACRHSPWVREVGYCLGIPGNSGYMSGFSGLGIPETPDNYPETPDIVSGESGVKPGVSGG